MQNIDDILTRLKRSRFRRRFRLAEREIRYLNRKGRDAILQQARELLGRRLAPTAPANDGRQTPWHGHPVFVAQHATATCCRSCLHKWHSIDKARALTSTELDYVVAVIGRWLDDNRPSEGVPSGRPLPLFD